MGLIARAPGGRFRATASTASSARPTGPSPAWPSPPPSPRFPPCRSRAPALSQSLARRRLTPVDCSPPPYPSRSLAPALPQLLARPHLTQVARSPSPYPRLTVTDVAMGPADWPRTHCPRRRFGESHPTSPKTHMYMTLFPCHQIRIQATPLSPPPRARCCSRAVQGPRCGDPGSVGGPALVPSRPRQAVGDGASVLRSPGTP